MIRPSTLAIGGGSRRSTFSSEISRPGSNRRRRADQLPVDAADLSRAERPTGLRGTIATMAEHRAAARKAFAAATHRRGGDEVADLLGEVEHAPQPGDLNDLARRAQAGDQAAREELIGRMLPLVNSIARAYRTTGLEHADLVQEGCVGILRALQRYDTDRGTPFSAYAARGFARRSRSCAATSSV